MNKFYLALNKLIFLFIAFFPHGAKPQSFDLATLLRGDHSYEEYYEIETSPTETLSLLNWEHRLDSNYQKPPPYHRTSQFSGWLRDPSGATCLDVRNLVLLRQAMEPVKLRDDDPCRIDSSTWHDPYSDEYFHQASDLQIDHVVPLKNAYQSGAWSWSPEKRCNYSNFLAYPEHLLAVQKHANLSKGERGPDVYLPLNESFQCQYLAIWLTIKAIWSLKIATTEANAIRDYLENHSCPKELFELRGNSYSSLKAATESPPKACFH